MDRIVNSAVLAHNNNWKNKTDDISGNTKLSRSIHREWMEEVEQFRSVDTEVIVEPNRRERIDVVSRNTMTAYELKVSGKNLKHEVYKDIMKVIIYNLNYTKDPIKFFVFISEARAIDSLKRNFSKKLLESIFHNYSFHITFEGIHSKK